MVVAMLAGCFGFGNRCAGSARFATWCLAREQLMDPLVGDAEDGGDVAHADPPASEGDGGFAGLRYSDAVGDPGPLSGLAGLFDDAAGALGQDWPGDKGDSALIGVEPHGGRLFHAGEGLVDGFAPGVHSWFFFEFDGPASVAFLFESGGVGSHVVLGLVFHRLSHLAPRQGSRSRSIDRSVPGVMSPVCYGDHGLAVATPPDLVGSSLAHGLATGCS